MEESEIYKLLGSINDAADVRALSRDDLPLLCDEVRSCIIDTISKTAGHLASGLGVVELTVALHYVYDTPHDILVWDVGHQAYPHKILTGHRNELATIRKYNGLHAFIWRNETPYDLLSTGHASTSIGSALGMAVAERNKPKDQRRKVVAIIGDGALSGGCAFEAMNHAGTFKDVDLTVILNDNEMSISENVGVVAQSLSHVISSPHYVKMVEGGKRILKSLPAVKDFAMRAQEHVKGMIMPGTMFEEFGFNYIGPVDGHDVTRLESILQNVKEMSGLTFLHVVTKKGKGYEPAEKDPICYHGVPAFNPEEGITKGASSEDCSYSAAFGRWMCDKAVADRKLMAVTPAMRLGSGLAEFARQYPHQFFDVAIAEQHAMVFASGLAAGGMRPVVNIYSSFMQRAYDGLIHDMAIQDLPMILCLDRGGLVGSDGPTHNGSYDIAYTRTVPNLMIMAPSTRHELYYMLNTAYDYAHPAVIRYPRANGESFLSDRNGEVKSERLSLERIIPAGQARVRNLSANALKRVRADLDSTGTSSCHYELFELNEGVMNPGHTCAADAMGSKKNIALLVYGPMAETLENFAREQDITLLDMRFIKPVNTKLIERLAQSYDLLVTFEEGAILGGIGEHIGALVAAMPGSAPKARVVNIGLLDNFVMEGDRNQLLAEQGLDEAAVRARVSEVFATL